MKNNYLLDDTARVRARAFRTLKLKDRMAQIVVWILYFSGESAYGHTPFAADAWCATETTDRYLNFC